MVTEALAIAGVKFLGDQVTKHRVQDAPFLANLAIGPAAGAPAGMIVPYGWYRPWGFGLFGPFMLVVFWFLLFRIFFWGGFHRRRWHYPGVYEAPQAFEEWHRRAHDRMSGQPGAGTENRV